MVCIAAVAVVVPAVTRPRGARAVRSILPLTSRTRRARLVPRGLRVVVVADGCKVPTRPRHALSLGVERPAGETRRGVIVARVVVAIPATRDCWRFRRRHRLHSHYRIAEEAVPHGQDTRHLSLFLSARLLAPLLRFLRATVVGAAQRPWRRRRQPRAVVIVIEHERALRVPAVARKIHGRLTLQVARVWVGSRLEHDAHAGRPPVRRGDVQRRVAGRVGPLEQPDRHIAYHRQCAN
mmetsp:Transcript_9411/g.33093  ORF Transcript_9411/g.33093 Transcript_9411/m.33093 type:complete len:237 (+) Transcript_9411:1266-1976(+)